MRRFLSVSLLLMGVFGFSTLCSKLAVATPLSNTSITTAQFGTIAGAVVATLNSTFDFAPTTPGGDGRVISTVYQGIGNAAGLYVYTYQLFHFSNSSENYIDAIRIKDFITEPVAVNIPGVGIVTSFYVDVPGQIAPGSGPGNTVWLSATAHLQFKKSPHWLSKGRTSTIFGVFSPLPPIVGTADVEDTGKQTYPSVLVPTPEPGAAILVFMGLAGVMLSSYRRNKKK